MASNNYIYKMSNAGGMSTLTRYTDMLAGNATWQPWEPAGAYDSIATVTVGSGGTGTVTFSSIPSTYTHLQLRFMARTNRAGEVTDTAKVSYNGDTSSSNYTYHEFGGDGSGPYVYGTGTPERSAFSLTSGATASANVFGVGIVDFLDYTNTSKYKTTRNLGGIDNNGSGRVGFVSSLWLNTAAITSITLVPGVGTTFNQYSQFALYGIKGN
jgi:hypothetical protein